MIIFEIPWLMIVLVIAALIVFGKWALESIGAILLIVAIIGGIVLVTKIFGSFSNYSSDNYYATEEKNIDDYWC